jgi:hypothetical protein
MKMNNYIRVRELADIIQIPLVKVIEKCMEHGIYVEINQYLDSETVDFLLTEFNKNIKMEKTKQYLKEKGFIPNDSGVYVYKSDDDTHRINLAAILEEFVEYCQEQEWAYAIVYNEDEFEGIQFPLEMLELLMDLNKYSDRELFPEFTDDKDTFHSIEVDYSHYARNGSKGVEPIKSFEEFKAWFLNRFSNLNKEVLEILANYGK